MCVIAARLAYSDGTIEVYGWHQTMHYEVSVAFSALEIPPGNVTEHPHFIPECIRDIGGL